MSLPHPAYERNLKQLDRREIALKLLPSLIDIGTGIDSEVDVMLALAYADALLKKTALEEER